jgi:hypothetical protein
MTDLLTVALGLLTDPRLGVPVVLLAVATVVWVVAFPASEPRRQRGEAATPEPDGDPVSRTFVALRHEAYSSVVVETHDRLERALVARTGKRLEDIPWRPSLARRLGIQDSKGLRQSRQELSSLYVWSARLETASWLRWDFWRTEAGSRAKFRDRLADRLGVVDRQLAALGYAP